MVDFDAHTIRIALHLLGVTVWVGGQLVLAALVPVLRSIGPDAPRLAANRFALVAWPFFALAVITGVWNVLEINVGDQSTDYHMVLGIKLAVVALSGIAAFLHSQTSSTVVRAVTGAGGLVTALAALVLGVMLAI